MRWASSSPASPTIVFADVLGPHRDLIAAAGDDARLIVDRDPELKSRTRQGAAGAAGAVRLEGGPRSCGRGLAVRSTIRGR